MRRTRRRADREGSACTPRARRHLRLPGKLPCSCRLAALDRAPREKLRHGLRNLERLTFIEARIAMGEIAAAEVLMAKLTAAAETLRHVRARHLQVHAAGVNAFGCRDLEEAS